MSLDDEQIAVRAAALFAEGHCAEAGDLLRPVAERELADVGIWNLLARAELAAERYEFALRAAEHTRLLRPNDALPDVLAGVALLKLGRKDEALACVRRAVANDRQSFAAMSMLARMLSTQGLHDDARAAAAEAAELAPDRPEAHMTIGVVAAAAGERDAARTAFREVLVLDPANGVAQHGLAHLRLHRRFNDPAALADAASGFARAAKSGTGPAGSTHSMEQVLRTFLSRVAYLLFVDAFFVGRVASSSGRVSARIVPIVLLLVPAYYAVRFLRRLTPVPRQRLVWLLVGERALSWATILEAICTVLIVVGALGAGFLRSGAVVVAALAAFAARLLLSLAKTRATRAFSGQPPKHAIRAGLIWVIAAVLGLLAIALIVAALVHSRPSAAVGALVSLAVAGALARVALRRGVSS